jgi:hypothetical protein
MQKRNRFSGSNFGRRPTGTYTPDYRLYDQLKAAWIATHPGATHDEYQHAMCDIAKKAGI